MKPTTYAIGTPYGVPGEHWKAGRHTGEDYLTPVGTPIIAPQRSRIIHAGTGGWGEAYGIHVVGQSVVGGTVFQWIAAHLRDVAISEGMTVQAGDLVGHSGRTGNVTGPHLHFEVRRSPFRYGDDVIPDLVTMDPVKTPWLDREIDQYDRQIAAQKPGPFRRALRAARQALLEARRIRKGGQG